MKLVLNLAILCTLFMVGRSYVTNPFSNTFRGGATSGGSNLSVGSLPNFTSANVAPAPVAVQAPQVTTTTTTVAAPQIQAPVIAAPAAHTHQAPAAPVAPVVGPAISHAHGPQVALPPQPVPGFPHAHSGHPYVAPAVAPQRMTYQQIIEYLTNTNGINLSTMLRNGSGNFLSQCKAYCDTLPPSPVCDSTNVLYRNECEAKCVHKTASTTNLRYGICCCSDNDFDYDVAGNVYVSNVATRNFCVSTCIFHCLGGQTPVEAQHSTDSPAMTIARSMTSCAIIS